MKVTNSTTMFKAFPEIPRLNDLQMEKARRHPNTALTEWCVTELIDGDHVALYADAEKNEYKFANRHRFLGDNDTYSAIDSINELYKHWMMEFSKQERKPVIVYGKIVGGHYGNKVKEHYVRSVCEYLEYNDIIVHDVLIDDKLVGVHQLEMLAATNILYTTPILYHGKFGECCGFPENRLSAIPFMLDKGYAVNFENEMKGIVIRPIAPLTFGRDYVIMKKLNRKYIGSQVKPQIKPELDETLLVEIADYIYSEGCRMHFMEKVFSEAGSFTYADAAKLAGLFTQLVLDNVTHLKYNLLDKGQKHLVNKEISILAKAAIIDTLRMGSLGVA